MVRINCKVISENRTSTGPMFTMKTFSQDDLILWVKRNCIGNYKIEITEKEVKAFFDDRVEIYTLEICEK